MIAALLPMEKPLGLLARNYRWKICAMLFLVTAFSYMDRQIVGLLKPLLEKAQGWTENDYVHIVMSFQVAYGIGYLTMGRLIDVTGVRWGLAVAVGVWSLFTIGHGVVQSLVAFCVMRIGLGLAEGGSFPGAVKAVSEWFPQQERALAKGVFTAGGSVGAALAPWFVPRVAEAYGWPAAFWLAGGLGFLFLILWFAVYQSPEKHTKVSAQELRHIQASESKPVEARISWVGLLGFRTTWAFIIGMFLTTPIWWFYLFWIPDFLHKAFSLPLVNLAGPLMVIYLMSDLGGVGGGFLSMDLFKRGWHARWARMVSLAVSVGCVMPLFLIPTLHGVWTSAVLIGLAGAAHQSWSSNIHAMIGDTMPSATVSSIVGMGGMAGSLGSILVAQLVGHLLQAMGSYALVFYGVPLCYLLGFFAILMLNPFREAKGT